LEKEFRDRVATTSAIRRHSAENLDGMKGSSRWKDKLGKKDTALQVPEKTQRMKIPMHLEKHRFLRKGTASAVPQMPQILRALAPEGNLGPNNEGPLSV
jgi:hypothetical protein